MCLMKENTMKMRTSPNALPAKKFIRVKPKRARNNGFLGTYAFTMFKVKLKSSNLQKYSLSKFAITFRIVLSLALFFA